MAETPPVPDREPDEALLPAPRGGDRHRRLRWARPAGMAGHPHARGRRLRNGQPQRRRSRHRPTSRRSSPRKRSASGTGSRNAATPARDDPAVDDVPAAHDAPSAVGAHGPAEHPVETGRRRHPGGRQLERSGDVGRQGPGHGGCRGDRPGRVARRRRPGRRRAHRTQRFAHVRPGDQPPADVTGQRGRGRPADDAAGLGAGPPPDRVRRRRREPLRRRPLGRAARHRRRALGRHRRGARRPRHAEDGVDPSDRCGEQG